MTIRAIQHALGLVIDGVAGANTINAIKTFQRDNGLLADGIVGPATWALLEKQLQVKESAKIDRGIFFAQIRSLFGRMSQSQVDGLNSLLDAVGGCLINEAAYMLATAYHETARTMLPIAEYGKGGKYVYGRWHKHNGNDACYKNGSKRSVYYRSEYNHLYYGRGYVQLTWFDNYALMGSLLGVDFLNYPELTMIPANAANIMTLGMVRGSFTGKKLSHYMTMRNADYVGARRIINGTDKASLIAGYAERFEQALRRAKN